MEIREINGMKGLFATKSYEIGDVICTIEGEQIPAATRTSLQIGDGIHIDVKAPIMFINHQCHANISLKSNTFVAITEISVGQEITFNYFETEDILSNPFICRDCGDLVKGKTFNSPKNCLNPCMDKVYQQKGNFVVDNS